MIASFSHTFHRLPLASSTYGSGTNENIEIEFNKNSAPNMKNYDPKGIEIGQNLRP